MGNENTIKNKQGELKKIRHHVTDLKVDETYHIPPIMTIERMDIKIVGIEGDDIKFKRVDSNTDIGEKVMKKSSILSRFLVKKLKY